MDHTSDESMDDLNEVMDDALLADNEQQEAEPAHNNNLVSRRRIEELMERKRLQSQLNDDFYDLELPEDL